MNPHLHLELAQQHYNEVVEFDKKLLAFRNSLVYTVVALMATGLIYYTH